MLTPLDADSCTLLTGTDDLRRLVYWVGLIGADVTVHEPAELREVMADIAARLADSATRVP